jgi:hypothetical protein
MQYKTIVLELLQSRTQLHDQLKSQRLLLPTLERLAGELKASHEVWQQQLHQVRPHSSPLQIASAALELAVKELEHRLPSASPPDENETLSLDAAMAFIQRRTPPV